VKILVTGSSGYVGSHTVKYLSQRGHEVFGLDRVNPPEQLKKYLSGDLRSDIAEQSAVEKYCQANNVEGVIHCAALCLVAESVAQPERYHDNNVVRGGKLLDAVQRVGIETFVFSSSAAVYGEPTKIPIPENHAKKPVNPYGETKRKFEEDLLSREAKGGLRVGIVRYFNAAGADLEGEIGEVHEPETHLIPNAILAALGKKPAFELFGTDYPTRDGTCERDFIHVWDLADAHLKLLQRISESGKGGSFNLGTGHGYTVAEVLDEVDRQSGKKVPRVHRPRRPGDPAVLVADATAAGLALAWRPQYSDLPKTIATSLEWHRQEI
jgi:UDP-glucose-4-epimerase GalE